MKLEIGYDQSFEIRRETCVTNCTDNFSVLYLSDLHLNKFSQKIIARVSKTIDELDPTVVLFGGDYMDSKKGLTHLNNLLSDMIFFISSNPK